MVKYRIKRRTTRRPLKKINRGRKVMPMRRYINNNHVFIKRQFLLPTVGATGLGWVSVPLNFRFGDLPSYPEMLLFDSYKIHAIKLTFTPFWDSNDLSNQQSFTTVLPRVYTIVDRNGFPAGSLATEAQFLEHSKSRQIRKPQEPFSIYIKNPGVETAAAIGGGFTANGVTRYSPWIDTSNVNIEHFGCAIGIILPAGNPNCGFYYNVVATYYLHFKNAV